MECADGIKFFVVLCPAAVFILMLSEPETWNKWRMSAHKWPCEVIAWRYFAMQANFCAYLMVCNIWSHPTAAVIQILWGSRWEPSGAYEAPSPFTLILFHNVIRLIRSSVLSLTFPQILTDHRKIFHREVFIRSQALDVLNWAPTKIYYKKNILDCWAKVDCVSFHRFHSDRVTLRRKIHHASVSARNFHLNVHQKREVDTVFRGFRLINYGF